MKKFLLILLSLLMLFGCSSNNQEETSDSEDSSACGIDTCDDDDKAAYLVAQNQISTSDALSKFENKEDFVLYFYFDACPWCKELGPLLSDYLEEKSDLLNMTYAINVRSDGNKENDIRYKNDDGEYNDSNFEEIYNLVARYLDDDGTFYVPTLIFVKDGEVKYFHTGTVDGHDATEREMTDDEKSSLTKELAEYYSLYGE